MKIWNFFRKRPWTRPAARDEYGTVSGIVYGALGIDPGRTTQMDRACLQDGTLYSWRNAVLLCLGGEVIGGMVAYAGEGYPEMKARTWDCCWDFEAGSQEDECGPDEYYIDSLMLFPEHRGHGYGRILLEEAERAAAEAGIRRVSLLVDRGKEGLVRYYLAAGYAVAGERTFLGRPDYLKMTKII